MSLDETFAAIPEGWRLYSVDASIVGRFSVMLSGPDHPVDSGISVVYIPQYASEVRPTFDSALTAAAEKAAAMYLGWLIEENWLHEWEATHPDFDGPEDSRSVTAKTREGVIAEIDEWIAENAA